MRLKRVTYILGLCAITWITIFYLLIVNRQLLTTDPKQNVDQQLALLEKEISKQFALNSQVISNAHKYLDKQKASNNDVPGIITESSPTFEGAVIPILVFACNRISISRCLDQLIKYRPNVNQFPIIISQVSLLDITFANYVHNNTYIFRIVTMKKQLESLIVMVIR